PFLAGSERTIQRCPPIPITKVSPACMATRGSSAIQKVAHHSHFVVCFFCDPDLFFGFSSLTKYFARIDGDGAVVGVFPFWTIAMEPFVDWPLNGINALDGVVEDF